MEVISALKTENCQKFFRLLRDPSTSYLQAACMIRMAGAYTLTNLRIKVVETINGTVGLKQKKGTESNAVPMADIAHLLCFDDQLDASEFCDALGYTVRGGNFWTKEDRKDFDIKGPQFYPKKNELISGKRPAKLQGLVHPCGGDNPSYPIKIGAGRASPPSVRSTRPGGTKKSLDQKVWTKAEAAQHLQHLQHQQRQLAAGGQHQPQQPNAAQQPLVARPPQQPVGPGQPGAAFPSSVFGGGPSVLSKLKLPGSVPMGSTTAAPAASATPPPGGLAALPQRWQTGPGAPATQAVENTAAKAFLNDPAKAKAQAVKIAREQTAKQVADLTVKGLAFMNSGDFARALAVYRAALDLDPKNSDLPMRIKTAEAEVAAGEKRKAEVEREKQRQWRQQQKETKVLDLEKRGDEFMAGGDYADAAKSYRAALKVDPQNNRLPDRLDTAEAEIAAAQARKAEEERQAVARRRAAAALAAQLRQLNAEATTAMQGGDYAGAVALYSGMLDLDPENATAKRGLQDATDAEDERVAEERAMLEENRRAAYYETMGARSPLKLRNGPMFSPPSAKRQRTVAEATSIQVPPSGGTLAMSYRDMALRALTEKPLPVEPLDFGRHALNGVLAAAEGPQPPRHSTLLWKLVMSSSPATEQGSVADRAGPTSWLERKLCFQPDGDEDTISSAVAAGAASGGGGAATGGAGGFCRLLALYEATADGQAPTASSGDQAINAAFVSAVSVSAAPLGGVSGGVEVELRGLAKGAAALLFECEVSSDDEVEWAAHRTRLAGLLAVASPPAAPPLPVVVVISTDLPELSLDSGGAGVGQLLGLGLLLDRGQLLDLEDAPAVLSCRLPLHPHRRAAAAEAIDEQLGAAINWLGRLASPQPVLWPLSATAVLAADFDEWQRAGSELRQRPAWPSAEAAAAAAVEMLNAPVERLLGVLSGPVAKRAAETAACWPGPEFDLLARPLAEQAGSELKGGGGCELRRLRLLAAAGVPRPPAWDVGWSRPSVERWLAALQALLLPEPPARGSGGARDSLRAFLQVIEGRRPVPGGNGGGRGWLGRAYPSGALLQQMAGAAHSGVDTALARAPASNAVEQQRQLLRLVTQVQRYRVGWLRTAEARGPAVEAGGFGLPVLPLPVGDPDLPEWLARSLAGLVGGGEEEGEDEDDNEEEDGWEGQPSGGSAWGTPAGSSMYRTPGGQQTPAGRQPLQSPFTGWTPRPQLVDPSRWRSPLTGRSDLPAAETASLQDFAGSGGRGSRRRDMDWDAMAVKEALLARQDAAAARTAARFDPAAAKAGGSSTWRPDSPGLDSEEEEYMSSDDDGPPVRAGFGRYVEEDDDDDDDDDDEDAMGDCVVPEPDYKMNREGEAVWRQAVAARCDDEWRAQQAAETWWAGKSEAARGILEAKWQPIWSRWPAMIAANIRNMHTHEVVEVEKLAAAAPVETADEEQDRIEDEWMKQQLVILDG